MNSAFLLLLLSLVLGVTSSSAQIRFLHAIEGGPAVVPDLEYVSDSFSFIKNAADKAHDFAIGDDALKYPSLTSYSSLEPGVYNIYFNAENGNRVLGLEKVRLESGMSYTFAAIGSVNAKDKLHPAMISALQDQNEFMDGTLSRIRVVNFATGASMVDYTISGAMMTKTSKKDAQKLANMTRSASGKISYGNTAQPAYTAVSGKPMVEIRGAGKALTVADIPQAKSRVYTVWIVGSGANVMTLVSQDKPDRGLGDLMLDMSSSSGAAGVWASAVLVVVGVVLSVLLA